MNSTSFHLQGLTPTLHELLVLAALRAGPRHGYEVGRLVHERSGGAVDLPYGTLYPILYRLEKRHLVAGSWSEGSGRRRRVYRLTHAGASRLRDESQRLRTVFDQLLRMMSA